MELQALYELHERLEAAAAAGTRLAGEDFRLKRAVENIKPLAEAAPVIKKLYLMAEQTAAGDCPDRAGALLDTLALSEAILCTQASVGVSGELRPLHVPELSLAPCQPHSVVKPLLEALTGAGSGRYSLIHDALQETPELFRDYRLQAAMVTALSDRYNDIAVLAENWLSSQDESYLPILKERFWECSESGRCRCLRAIAAIAAERENDFYLSVLSDAKKDLRVEAIFALRFDSRNGSVLLDLTKTEKGSALDAVRRVLASLDTAETEQYLSSFFEKKPWEALQYVTASASQLISEQLGAFTHAFLDECERAGGKPGREQKERLSLLLGALTGKVSASVISLYERAAGAGTSPELYGAFPGLLMASLIRNPDERLMLLAHSLAASSGDAWTPAALAADLLTLPAAAVFDQYHSAFPKKSILGIGREEKNRTTNALMAVFARICYVQKYGRQDFFFHKDTADVHGFSQTYGRPLKENLDPRWFALFTGGTISCKEPVEGYSRSGNTAMLDYDQILANMAAPAQYPELGRYFYDKALIVLDNRRYYDLLKLCGWKNYRGLVVRYVEKNVDTGISFWEIRRLVDSLPFTDEERCQEIRDIDDFLCTYPMKSPARRSWDSSTMMRKMIDEAAGLPGGE